MRGSAHYATLDAARKISPSAANEKETPLIEEIRQKVHELEGRDLQLSWAGLVVTLVLAGGVVALLLPGILWERATLGLDFRYTPQIFFGFIALILLFSLYTLELRRELRHTREELFRQLFRSRASEEASPIDPLTEIFSRSHLDHVLAKEVSRADRQRSSLTFLIIDVNDFKSLNQRFGQLVGDRLLNDVGQLLIETFRRSDTIVRYGGDEFLVLLPETDEEQAGRAVERLLGRVNRWNRENALPGYHLSFSCGLATYARGNNAKKLIEAAEQRKNVHRDVHSRTR